MRNFANRQYGKGKGGSRQHRRRQQRRSKSGFSPGVSVRNLAAFERYAEGIASDKDFSLVAQFLRASGALSPTMQAMSDADLGRAIQQADRLITEGVVRVVLPEEGV